MEADHARNGQAYVALSDAEALRLQEALRAARELMTWVLTLPSAQATWTQRDAVLAQLRTLEEFQRAHDEAHGLGGH